jgi:hypothetical protein
MIRIEVVVSPEGEISVQTKGFIGSLCRDASQFLEKALGVSVNEQVTAEFYQVQQIQQNQQQEC